MGMFASARGIKPAVLGLASLLPLFRILEAIAASSLVQTHAIELASSRGPTKFRQMMFVSLSVRVIRRK